MDVLVGVECRNHVFVLRDVRQYPQLDLGVVGIDQLAVRLCLKEGAQAAAQLGADRDVLQVWLGGAEPASAGIGLVEVGVDASVLGDYLEQTVHIGGFELGKLAVFQNLVDDFVLAAQAFQHLGAGGVAGFGLFAGGQTQLFKENLSELLG